MPEGHTLHRLARRFTAEMRGRVVRASSPQGRFAAGAAVVDGRVLERAEAHGKHLWLGFGDDVEVHVHLGLYGTWTFGAGEPPPPRGAVRLRLTTATAWADLRGPTACEVHTPEQKDAVHGRLGPDPLRRDELWRDLVLLLRDGVRRGRIITTLPGDRARRGRVGREDAHYVYRRTGLPCRVCGTPVTTAVLAARNLYWCPVCKAAA